MRCVTRTGPRTSATGPAPRRAGADRRVTLGLLAAAATVAVASCLHLGGRTPPGFTTPAPATLGLRTTEVTYPGGTEHIRAVRADLRTVLDDCPRADDVILCASELAANAALHSRSRLPGGTFTVRATVSPGPSRPSRNRRQRRPVEPGNDRSGSAPWTGHRSRRRRRMGHRRRPHHPNHLGKVRLA